MKKQEALDLILSEQDKGTDKQEIVEILMSQDKIGNTKPTPEYIEALFSGIEVAGNGATGDGGAGDAQGDKAAAPNNSALGISEYEKWEISGNGERLRKLKTMRMPDHVAEVMNQANMSGRGYSIKYIKK